MNGVEPFSGKRKQGGKAKTRVLARLDPYELIGAPPEMAANTPVCLANQGIFLLKRQIERLERDFVEKGGFTERLYRVRTQRRREQP